MTREGTTAALNAAQAAHVRIVVLAELLFDSGTVRASTADRSIFFDPDGGSPVGEEFLGLGNLAGISPVNETAELRPSVVELILTGIASEFISLAFEKAQGRQARIWLGFLDDSYALIVDPVLVFKGLMDNSKIEMGDTGTVTIPVNSRLIEWQRAKVIRYTNEDQKARFAGDKFFEFVQQTVEKELLWGVGGTGQVPRAAPAQGVRAVVDQAFDSPGSSVISDPNITPADIQGASGGTLTLIPFGRDTSGGVIRNRRRADN